MASMESLEKIDWPTPPSCAPDLPRTRSCGGKSKESPWEGGQVWPGPRAGDRARSGSGPVPAISRILREACPSEASFIMGTPYWSWGRSWEVCPGGGGGGGEKKVASDMFQKCLKMVFRCFWVNFFFSIFHFFSKCLHRF